jgi:AraC family ethanolamine operon transcriptional activator
MAIRNAHGPGGDRRGPIETDPTGRTDVRVLDTDDPAEWHAWSAPWDHTFRQTTPGRLSAQAIQFRGADAELTRDRASTGVFINGAPIEGTLLIVHLLERHGPCYSHGPLAPDRLLVIDDQDEVHFLSRSPAEWIVLAVAAEDLVARAERTGASHLLDLASGVRPAYRSPAARRTLSAQLVRAIDLARISGLDERLRDDIIDALSRAIAPNGATPDVPHGDLADHARVLIERSIPFRAPLGEIYERLGAAPRTIQKAFDAAYGVSPREYRSIAQLNLARQILRRPRGPDPVRRAAIGAGCFHFGRFSAQYKAFFGEFPSETVGRAREAEGPKAGGAS